MARSIIALFVFATLTSLASAADKYTSKDGKYTATFPVAPKESDAREIDVPALGGKIKQFTTSLDVKKDLAFMVIYNDYPEFITMAAPQKVLQLVRDGCKGAKGTLERDKEIVDAKPPAREFVVDKDGVFYRARAILSGTRLYQVVVVARNKEALDSKEANEFIESFAITN